MPVEITLEYLGEPEKEKALRAGLNGIFKDYQGTWEIHIIGDQQNTIWKTTIKAADNLGEHVHKFYGEDGGHAVENVLAEVSRIAEGLRKRKSA
jgi:hypothetical protein